MPWGMSPRFRFRSGFCWRTCCGNEDGESVTAADIEASRAGTASRTRCERSASCRRACCCRISPACPAWSIWPPCATRSPRWAATRDRANPLMPADLVIDHSVQVDQFGTTMRSTSTPLLEFQRNRERYIVPALGPDGVPQFPRRAARHRHRPPGEPGISGAAWSFRERRRRRRPIPTPWWAPIRTPR